MTKPPPLDIEDDRPPAFVVRDPTTGAVIIEWMPDDPLWLDMRAFAEAAGLTVTALVQLALERYLTSSE